MSSLNFRAVFQLCLSASSRRTCISVFPRRAVRIASGHAAGNNNRFPGLFRLFDQVDKVILARVLDRARVDDEDVRRVEFVRCDAEAVFVKKTRHELAVALIMTATKSVNVNGGVAGNIITRTRNFCVRVFCNGDT